MNLALLAAAASGVLAGTAIAVTRLAVAEVPPLTLAMLRYSLGCVCLLPFVLAHFRPVEPVEYASGAIKYRASDLLAMAALGIGQFGVLIALLNWGLQRVEAAPAALVFGLFPLLTLCLGAALGRERIGARLLLGVLLSIAGVAVSLLPKLGAPQSGIWWGELAVLGAACTGALCSVLYRPYLQRYPTLPVSAYAMLASVLFLALAALTEAWPQRLPGLSGRAWAAIAFVGLSSAVGYYWWLYALKHESPTRVTVFLSLNPVAAALMGWAVLGEALSANLLAAMALIAAGLWLATRAASKGTGIIGEP
ncbi:DMT family transporter [uncultured Ramlibacter sp.]|uniref:DMT family transporter n=1 Tax=uncultured Ramlibacter sp. TaxID=260755 RepID=UPI0026230A69|nr:DMT family transporter [uncultured Ramlibacter sp.]